MKHSSPRPLLQAGFSLVELLISITIGLVIVIAIGLVYVNSSNINRQKEDLADSYEPIKMVTNLVGYNISMAGYIDPVDLAAGSRPQGSWLFDPAAANTPTDPNMIANMYARNTAGSVAAPLQQFFAGLWPIFGCDGAMNGTPNALATAGPPAALACGTADATKNSFQVAYQVRPATGTATPLASVAAPNANTGEGFDCLQQALPGAAGTPGNSIVINRFYVATNAGDGVNELYCAGSGNATPRQIARGVEEFVVRYQLAQASPSTGFASGYSRTQFLTAAQVNALPIANPGNAWGSVAAVDVCMVTATVSMRGAAAVGTVQVQPTRPTCERQAGSNDFGGDIARASGDFRLWKRSTFTYIVRSAVFSSPALP